MAAIGSGECDVGELDTTSSGDTDGDMLSACSQLEAGSIQAIDRESVHRICSGQVVLTLATAVKELVENSIDAGATTVDIKLKEYGSESIEVTDNGSGVEEKNFAGLTQKHHTSKLSDFNDLIHVETFGFRGEALSSLCALSHMTVTTRHRSVAVGTKLEYDVNGHIVSKTPTPRQQGTTITLQNLFHTLPVRHKEFQRNLKKEFSKMVQVLNAYCIVNTGVRITCSNQTSKGSRSTVVSTNGNSTVKDNIANIFGPKQLQSLLPFEQQSPTEDVCTDYGIQSDACHTDVFSIEGFVSKCEHGQGRSSTDRQFIFINRRPCDVTKIVKVVNEVYHSYNRHQYPFVVLLITMAKESVDVNVTPDKRQIFMEGEKILLATIKTSLVKMFEPTTSILRMNLVQQPPGSLGTTSDSSGTTGTCPAFVTASQSSPEKLEGNGRNEVKDGCALSSLARLKRSFSSAFDRTDRRSWTSPVKQQPDKQRKLETFLNKSHSTPARFSPDKGAITRFFTASSSSPSPVQKPLTSESVSPNKSVCDDVLFIEHIPTVRLSTAFDETDSPVVNEGVSARLSNCSEEATPQSDEHHRSLAPLKIALHEVSSGVEDRSDMVGEHSRRIDPTSDPETLQPQDVSHSGHEALRSDTLLTSSAHAGHEDSEFNDPGFHMHSKQRNRDSNKTGSDREEAMTIVSVSDSSEIESQASHHFSSAGSSNTVKDGARQQPHVEEDDRGVQLETSDEKRDQGPTSTSLSVTVTQFDKDESRTRRESELPFSFQKLRACLTSADMKSQKERDSGFSRSFRAKICPTDNKSAEDELQREISKDMFSKMDVLGQFNLGFIIAKNGKDLFIVDQHATDEKYNFEMLQRHTVLQSQQLIQPQCLELTASNEVILIDNLDIFRKNGFDFVIDETAPPTQRVKLKSTPISKNWTFGKDDIEELIFMLTDSPGVMCRPSRVRMMFASRACRKSIMIGTHLNRSEMKKLLCHMGEIEQPWNCPHGRPTMRHLINLDMLPTPR